jgi:hypothetical protein
MKSNSNKYNKYNPQHPRKNVIIDVKNHLQMIVTKNPNIDHVPGPNHVNVVLLDEEASVVILAVLDLLDHLDPLDQQESLVLQEVPLEFKVQSVRKVCWD